MIYFRVLYSQEHYGCWSCDPPANSSHHRPPTAWIEAWKTIGNADEVDKNYPLLCEDCGKQVRFTARARETFLANPTKDYSQCSPADAYLVGELDGVCAFFTAEGCLAWISGNPRFQRNPADFDFVAFEGEFVSGAPEDQGVVAKFVRKENGLMKVDQFKKDYIR
jgi:hypothetical protein